MRAQFIVIFDDQDAAADAPVGSSSVPKWRRSSVAAGRQLHPVNRRNRQVRISARQSNGEAGTAVIGIVNVNHPLQRQHRLFHEIEADAVTDRCRHGDGALRPRSNNVAESCGSIPVPESSMVTLRYWSCAATVTAMTPPSGV